ncbi:uncharacterized protein LOC127519755 isoform X2 [Ctenopharyngodon idella]|uniref:uncharacterized protein LOC127519755 isoform X2 n=1 Tax=Ctenopharyngodon idella TaxID=7959 RepID=UPI00222EC352|nr:uncharacterized protein LOC127519755 isoform X2 [Ctenopharyngodon idella]
MKSALILFLFSSSVIGVFGDTDEVKVSVMEGDSVTLYTDVAKIQGSDSIEWRFNGNRMARIKSDSITPDKSFRDTMQLNNMTGDLKITNITTTDSGLYKLKIKSSSGSPEKTFSVTVVISGVKSVSVKEGDSVTLNTGVNELQRDDVIRWRHQNVVAGIDNNYVQLYRGGLELDRQTGSLTITNITIEYAGDYEVDVTISSRRYTIHKSFSVNVNELKSVSVMEGDSATLNSDLTEIQRDDVIRWSFGKITIAEIIKADQQFSTYDGPDRRFRGRLNLDHQTGSLNIMNIIDTDSGNYTLKISSSRFTVHKRISVTVNETVTLVLVMEGDSVTLHTDHSKISRNDIVQWSGDKNVLITPSDARWSNTVQNDQTGDLTIRNIRRDQSGDYKIIFMDIQMRFMSIRRKFHINISDVFSDETDGMKTVSVIKGDSVFLNTSVTEIQKGDLIEWLFGAQNITIAKTDGKNNSIYNDKDVRFKNRLNLDKRTGGLTIENSNIEHSGHYQLKIINNNKYTIQKSFSVTVSLSSGAIAAIVVAVVLVFLAAAAGVIYYLCKSSIPERSSARHWYL